MAGDIMAHQYSILPLCCLPHFGTGCSHWPSGRVLPPRGVVTPGWCSLAYWSFNAVPVDNAASMIWRLHLFNFQQQ